MSVKKDASGRRSIQVEVEVPGTPEEVWQAIATGPGVSSWFVPTDIDMGAGGTPTQVVSHFGPGMDAVAKVTAWDPPRRFAAEGEWGPGSPTIATEWIVEARAGGKCIVRVVHSLFASTDDWDNQLHGVESGWPGFFRILSLYLTHFRGQRCTAVQLMGMSSEPEAKAWQTLTDALGLAGVSKGGRWSAPAGAPRLTGQVEHTANATPPYILLVRLDPPVPGIASVAVYACGGPIQVAIGLFLYGDAAADVAAREEPSWRAWMQKQFPAGQ